MYILLRYLRKRDHNVVNNDDQYFYVSILLLLNIREHRQRVPIKIG